MLLIQIVFRRLFCFLFFFVSSFSFCFANVHEVGPIGDYLTPNALYVASQGGGVSILDGDTIEIAMATYSGQDVLAVWSADDLVIRGVGGRPHLEAAGQYIWGKGIWVISGDNATVENIEFSGATVPDMNGAGIRLDGNGLTIRSCYFHNNEDGILTSNSGIGDVLVEYSEFSANGAGDGFSHNIYVGHINMFTLQYCYMHHCDVGNQIKSRANTNIIRYNRIMDEASGNSSMLLDLPNGGFSVVTGNVFHQGSNAQNGRSVSFGTEGSNPIMELYMSNNTFVNERFNGRLIDVSASTTVADITNTILVNYDVINQGSGSIDTSNIIRVATLAEAGLESSGYSFRPLAGSPAINSGIDPGNAGAYSLTPDKEYIHPTSFASRPSDGVLDIGAFEYVFPPSTVYYVSNLGNDNNTGLSLADAFLTLQKASDVVFAGDQVLVEDGSYAGFDHRSESGTAGQPIEFKAMDSAAEITSSGPIRNDGINIEGADYIILDGFIANDMPGNGNGIRVVVANNCEIRNCSCDNNAERGIFTAFTDDILIEYNICTNSIDEHGIYVSNSSDRPIIRYNECYGNNGIGIHMNGDLSAGGDGIISDAQVYGNILHDNNSAAGINMDGVVNPLVYNNLIYNNHFAQGIALFQQDGAVVTSGAKIYNNTIIVPSDGRWGILVKDGANVGTEIYNNIIINQHAWRGCIAVENTSQLESDYNILNDKMSNVGDGSTITLAAWQALGFDNHSLLADAPAMIFMDFPNDDYHLNTTSQAINNGTSLVNAAVTEDIEGNSRPQGNAYDIGSYESSVILAVELENPLSASLLNKGILLKWSTALEVNSDYFRIVRSNNLQDWKTLGEVYSKVNSTQGHSYDFVDSSSMDGVNYYKLVEVDNEGIEQVLGMISISYSGDLKLQVFPNPAKDNINLAYLPRGLNGEAHYEILATNGLLVEKGTINNNRLDISKISQGIYFLRIYVQNSVFQEKLVIGL